MGTQRVFGNEKDFLQNLTLNRVVEFRNEALQVEVKRQRDPLQFTAFFWQKKDGRWQKFFTSTSAYVGDIIDDCKKEFSIFNN